METAQKVITAVGGIIAIIGLSWILNGAFDFFSGRKNNDPNRQDQGMSSMISGGAWQFWRSQSPQQLLQLWGILSSKERGNI